ncbi:MAG: hypothetical protein IPP67_00775 [Rhodospirillaceae bacterium]|nr:hypothetical protein [Rhodospirillaceae bacterium]
MKQEIAIIVGMGLEAALLKDFPQKFVGVAGGNEKKVKSLTQGFIEQQVEGLVSFGFAGGLDPDLDVGTVIVAKSVATLSGQEILTSAKWGNKIGAQLGGFYSTGTILGSKYPIIDPQQKIDVFHQTNAVAVDMESYAMAEIAHAYQIPFTIIRVILDPAQKKIHPKIAALFQADGKIDSKGIIKILLKEPKLLKEFLDLGRQFYLARRRLNYVARLFCPDFAFGGF